MSTDSYIDKQYDAAVPNYSQLVIENRYANYVSLTFTSASMWSNKSTPSAGPDSVKLFGSGEPHIVGGPSSSDEVTVVSVDLP